jgi:hypothetical protein
MKECFAITTYCNTSEKIQTLLKTIDNVKQYELPIFVHAHYPLPDVIQRNVHSYFYSSNNPILKNRFNKFWYSVERYKLEITVYDYYFTTLKGWDESIKICDDYDKIHIINYDANITPDLFSISQKYDKSIFLQNPDNTLKTRHILPTYFCLKKESFDFFRENITMEKYIGFREISTWPFLPLIEEFIPYFTVGDNFLMIPNTDYDHIKLLENDIASDTRFNWEKSLCFGNTKIFIGDYNNSQHILFFDIKRPITVLISTKNSHITQPLSSATLIKLYETDDLMIYVDGVPIGRDLIQKFSDLECKFF